MWIVESLRVATSERHFAAARLAGGMARVQMRLEISPRRSGWAAPRRDSTRPTLPEPKAANDDHDRGSTTVCVGRSLLYSGVFFLQLSSILFATRRAWRVCRPRAVFPRAHLSQPCLRVCGGSRPSDAKNNLSTSTRSVNHDGSATDPRSTKQSIPSLLNNIPTSYLRIPS
jgi:hypothetical protein